nr:MAG TPA: hypothetical protein [Caudoviricetes sp.]
MAYLYRYNKRMTTNHCFYCTFIIHKMEVFFNEKRNRNKTP